MRTWEIDYEAVEQARGILGIDRYPVRVRILDGGPQGMLGKYHGLGHWGPTTDERLDEPVHHISLKGDLTSKMANTCLLHEMTHAAQCERYLDDDYQSGNRGLTMAFKQEMKGNRGGFGNYNGVKSGYSDVSFEREARETMDLLDDDIKVVKQVAPEAEVQDPLRDEDGRFLWRVDVWEEGPWDKKAKKREYTFEGTYYVWAKDEWDAKKWARQETDLDYNNSTIKAYKMDPTTRKKGGE